MPSAADAEARLDNRHVRPCLPIVRTCGEHRTAVAADAAEVVVTNTLPPNDDQRFDKLTVLSIAPLLAQATAAVFEDGSVTSLFS